MWKRALVFLLGVAQIVIGSLIVYSSAGSLTSFGTHMIL
jgi:hypothetical protein